MLFRDSPTNQNRSPAVDHRKYCIEAAMLINSKQWLATYHLLEPLAKESDDTAILYNMSLCYYFVDESESAILLLQKILNFPSILAKSVRINPPQLDQKLNQLEAQSDNYFFALTPIVVDTNPNLVKQRTKRLLIDALVKQQAWPDILRLAKQLEVDAFPNVVQAQQLALRHLNKNT